MFGFLKNLLGKPTGIPAQASAGATVTAAPSVQNQVSGNGGSHSHPRPQNGTGVQVSLQAVLSTLPLELQAKVVQPEVGELTIAVPLERILPQLAHGSVKISFAELRSAAPEIFTPAPDLDRTPVLLPLGEILARINPALIKRRRVQRQIAVPPEIASPFDPTSRNIVPPPRSDTEVRLRSPEGNGHKPIAPLPAAPPVRAGLGAIPTAPKPPGVPFSATSLPPSGRLAQPVSSDTSLLKLTQPAPKAVEKPSPTPSPTPDPVASTPGAQQAAPEQTNRSRTADQAPLIVGLTSLAEAWPDTVRKEIVQSNLVDARLALPGEVIERALKSGRIAFTWKMLRSWIKPAVPLIASAQDGAVLELPLKVVAPLFLARQKANKPSNKVEIDETIPNLFFGFPQADPGPGVAAATARPADTNFYVWDDKAEGVKLAESETRTGPSAGTKFVSKYATPNEIVSRAAVLDGVAGAIIALPDGLLVASRIPADFNADTLAAFLPQIFGKVSQCTKELRMGDLNNLNFTVGNVPWKIFRVNAIFFAAFGRPAEPLPTAQLAALAAELDHKPK